MLAKKWVVCLINYVTIKGNNQQLMNNNRRNNICGLPSLKMVK